MIFGWGKKKESAAPETRHIRLDDVPKIIGEQDKRSQARMLAQVRQLGGSCTPLIQDLVNIGSHLEQDSLDVDDVDRHVGIIVRRGKKQVIDVIKKDAVPLPDAKTVDDAVKLELVLGQILKKIGDVLGRQTRVIHIFAKKYAAQLKNNLEVLNSKHAEIKDLLKSYQNNKALADRILESLGLVDSINASCKIKAQKVSEMTRSLESTIESIGKFDEKIKAAKSSENYKNYTGTKKSLDDFTAQKSAIKGAIDAQFTKISRPLGRYVYASSLDKEHKAVLSGLTGDPFGILTAQNKDSIILILENIRKAVTSGSISVKDVQKSMQHITEVEESIDGLVSEISRYDTRLKSLQEKLDSIDLQDLDSALAGSKKQNSEKTHLESVLKSLDEEIKDDAAKIPSLVSGIQADISRYFSARYVIDPD